MGTSAKEEMRSRKPFPTISAKTIFETGPARDVIAVPHFGFLKLYELIGTGLLHPNRKINSDKAPIGSICARGFSVSLPFTLGVKSPNLYAVYAWANSWIVDAINTDITEISMEITVNINM